MMSVQDWRIYQLLDSRGFGGIESHVLNLSRWLTGNGYRNEVVFLNDHGEHPLKQALNAQGIQWRCLNGPAGLYRLLAQAPGLLCTHGYKAGIIGRSLARWHRVPVLSTYHSGDRGQGRLRLYSWLDEVSAVLADRIISVSAEISARLPVASEQIVNFVAREPFPTQRGSAIAFVGRLSDEKDPQAFARATRNLSLPCHIYGDGPDKDKLRSGYPHLTFFGHVDMAEHWSDIGLLCITSKAEGLPLVALEAMVRGIPVVSYAVGGLPDLIQHGRNGWLIPAGDEAQLHQTLQSWELADATQKAAVAVSAHHHIVRHYSDDRVCPKITALYKQAIQRHGQLVY